MCLLCGGGCRCGVSVCSIPIDTWLVVLVVEVLGDVSARVKGLLDLQWQIYYNNSEYRSPCTFGLVILV